MGSIRARAGAVGLVISSVAFGGNDVMPLELFGIDGRYERTANGDILLYPSAEVSVLRHVPVTFAIVPEGVVGPLRVFALPETTSAAMAAEPDALPIPGPFRGSRYQFPPLPPASAWGYGRTPAWLYGAYADWLPGAARGW